MDDVTPQIAQITIDTTHARASAEFWRALLGLVYREGHEPRADGEDDPAGHDWLNLYSPLGHRTLAFQQVDVLTPSTWPDDAVPQQMHLDLTVRTIDELNAVHARVLNLGGALLLDRTHNGDEPLRVYADLDGHPFCIFVLDES
jgi:catechol 2,3-dioxygenase-like lactoylglutathione lyase family enzyme